MNNQIRISIIIVNYNTCKLTCECIASIYANVFSVKFEIVLIDNDSSDNSVSKIRQQFPEVKLIASRENLGFGRANNLGVRHAKGEFVFLLNSDTILKNDPFPFYMDFFQTKSSTVHIGALGSYLFDAEGNYSKSGGTFYSSRKYLLMAFKRLFKLSSREELPYLTKEAETDYVIGADIFFKKETFEELGGFDEHIFMYFEDVELCKRLHSRGYKSYVIPGPNIIHFVKASSTSQFSRIYNIASLIYCLQKEIGTTRLLMFQITLFLLKSPLLFGLHDLKQNMEYLLTIFKYKKYLL